MQIDLPSLLLVVTAAALVGAMCAYIGGKVFDGDQYLSRDFREIFNLTRDSVNRRLSRMENWQRRFVAHHNREHAAAKGATWGNDQLAAAIELHRQEIGRIDRAVHGLIAANGDMNGLKAFVDAIHAVQNKQEDRLAALERNSLTTADAIITRPAGWEDLDKRLAALERKSGPRKSGR